VLRPWAYLVPQPGRPVLALPITEEVAASMSDRKFSRAVRDSVALAPLINGVRWTQWELTSRTQGEELLALARLSHQLCSGAAQPA
jgi:hypothetical protein